MPRSHERHYERSSAGTSRSARVCDRCHLTFSEGYTWPGLGIPLTLCNDCTEDIEESVRSYGETGERGRMRLLDRLRSIGT
ncbi:MAG TPA: hypothetical protein VFY10_11745 [Dehalococcoidia bacterium]|nr:hypothetical protein [Dehalococcoidia bacterium]